jgi:membrane-associated protein
VGELTIFGLLFLVCVLDAFFPIVPSETMVIAASVMAAHGDLFLWSIPVLAALGSFAGDQVSYGAGRMLQQSGHGRFLRSPRSRNRLAWTTRQVDGRGATLIVTARFVPGGRTVTTLAAGALGMPWRRFALADACAAALWATFATALGYFGGRAFDSTWKAIALSLALAFLVAALSEALRRPSSPRQSERDYAGYRSGSCDASPLVSALSLGSSENKAESIRPPLKG